MGRQNRCRVPSRCSHPSPGQGQRKRLKLVICRARGDCAEGRAASGQRDGIDDWLLDI